MITKNDIIFAICAGFFMGICFFLLLVSISILISEWNKTFDNNGLKHKRVKIKAENLIFRPVATRSAYQPYLQSTLTEQKPQKR